MKATTVSTKVKGFRSPTHQGATLVEVISTDTRGVRFATQILVAALSDGTVSIQDQGRKTRLID